MARLGLFLIWCLICGAAPAAAQGLTGLARYDPARSGADDTRRGTRIQIAMSQPVPYRVFTLDAPFRLVIDFSILAWDGFSAEQFSRSDAVLAARAGALESNWSRIVLDLGAPLMVSTAELDAGPEPRVDVVLREVSEAEFVAASGAPASVSRAYQNPAEVPPPRTRPDGIRPVVVVLDPGHGGIDPGAERAGVAEKDLVLTFALELREALLRTGGFKVAMTRDSDVFIPLETRQSIARAAGADVFISLHADALLEGRASGATIYTLAEEASDIASQRLAERHNRSDLLAGVDLSRQGDQVALVLMDMVRNETKPRTDQLADALVDGLRHNIGNLHKRPRLEAAFSVLKSPDIPSVLIELGFMSSSRDLANIQSPEWRARAASGIRDALRVWAAADAAEAELLRQ